MGRLDFENLLRQTPKASWCLMTAIIVQWIALTQGYLSYEYIWLGGLTVYHKINAILFAGPFFRYLAMNLVGVHMGTWYVTQSL